MRPYIMDKFNAYGNNIEVLPDSKNKIIGDTSKYYLFGTVISVGDQVKDFKEGDRIGYVLWGLNEILHADGHKQFFVQENPDFIVGIIKK